MNKQIDAEKLIGVLINKIAELELENAKLSVLISEFSDGKDAANGL